MYACASNSSLVLAESRSPATGVADGCEVPCECWILNPSSL